MQASRQAAPGLISRGSSVFIDRLDRRLLILRTDPMLQCLRRTFFLDCCLPGWVPITCCSNLQALQSMWVLISHQAIKVLCMSFGQGFQERIVSSKIVEAFCT